MYVPTCYIGNTAVAEINKLSPGRPHWVNFRLMGDCLLWADNLKIQDFVKFLA
jgi:hypothetical protein